MSVRRGAAASLHGAVHRSAGPGWSWPPASRWSMRDRRGEACPPFRGTTLFSRAEGTRDCSEARRRDRHQCRVHCGSGSAQTRAERLVGPQGPECQAGEPGLVCWPWATPEVWAEHRWFSQQGRPGARLHGSLLSELRFPDALASLVPSCSRLLLREPCVCVPNSVPLSLKTYK